MAISSVGVKTLGAVLDEEKNDPSRAWGILISYFTQAGGFQGYEVAVLLPNKTVRGTCKALQVHPVEPSRIIFHSLAVRVSESRWRMLPTSERIVEFEALLYTLSVEGENIYCRSKGRPTIMIFADGSKLLSREIE